MKSDDLGPLHAPRPDVIDGEFRVVAGQGVATGRREPLFKPRSGEPLIRSWGGLARLLFWIGAAPLFAAWFGQSAMHLLFGPHP